METIEKRRPIWLLDVDGVINVPWTNPPAHVWAGKWQRREKLYQFPFLTAQPVLDFITRIHEEGLAEVRWHTTWQHAAHKIEDEFGLPRFEVQPAPEFHLPEFTIRGGHWFKLPAAERLIEEGHTVVWTDDDLRWQAPRDRDRIAKLRRTGRLLTIAPDDRTGLTPAHLRKIEAFLRAQQSDLGHTEEWPTSLRRSTVHEDDATGSDRDERDSAGLAAMDAGAQGDSGIPAR